MGLFSLLLFGASAICALAYLPPVKEHMLSEALLREVVERMGQDLEGYLEDTPPGYPQLMSRSGDYQENPTVRDHEYLQHSSLWNNPFMSGDNENNHLGPVRKPESNKQEALPAYCNPPNPCPIGYTAEEGCLEEFENTAGFSREYQAQQDCMCDSEHMFDCSNNRNPNDISETDFDRLVHQFHSSNPYLEGERLPVAAKKGINIPKII